MGIDKYGDFSDAVPHGGGPSVTSAELVRQFGYWRQQAEHGPVFVSHHGRDTHVLLTKISFEGLTNRDVGEVGDPLALLADLTEHIHEAFVLLDTEMRVRLINPAGCNAFRVRREDVVGKPLSIAFPRFEQSFLYPKVVRALQFGESSSADAPALTHNEGWIHFQAFPFDGGVASLFRDITEEVRTHRLADAKAALIHAMEIHGEVGHIRVSARGIISRADQAFTKMLQLPEDRLIGIPLVDIVAKTERIAVRDALENVLGRSEPETFETQLLANDGSFVPIRAAMVELRGEYASEGAVMVATRH
jgi:PAS domain-containing protein